MKLYKIVGTIVLLILISDAAYAVDESTLNCPSTIPGEAATSYNYAQALYDDFSHAGWRQYAIQTFVPPAGYSPNQPKVFELCVYTDGTLVQESQLAALYSGYGVFFPGNSPDDYFGFRKKPTSQGGTYIPVDGNLYYAGEANYGSTKPGETIVLHIIDDVECSPQESCYRGPKEPYDPIPELSTIVLTSTGLLGILLISRRYRKI